MFRGSFIHTLDDKSRVILPQKLRNLLGEKFIITKGLDGCLWVFSEDGFRELDGRLNAQPMLDPDAIYLQRFFSGNAVDATTDTQGRVALVSGLREYAAIDKEVVIVGVGNRIEMWGKARWDELRGGFNDDLIRESAKKVGIG